MTTRVASSRAPHRALADGYHAVSAGHRVVDLRALARTGDAGEHRQPAFWQPDSDILEAAHARAVHTDRIITVDNVQRRRLRVLPRAFAHRVSVGWAGSFTVPSADHGGDRRTAQRASLMRIWLPEGSRKAQSRIPYGCMAGSWMTSAPLACSRAKVPSRSAVARMIMP